MMDNYFIDDYVVHRVFLHLRDGDIVATGDDDGSHIIIPVIYYDQLKAAWLNQADGE